eukprot:403347860
MENTVASSTNFSDDLERPNNYYDTNQQQQLPVFDQQQQQDLISGFNGSYDNPDNNTTSTSNLLENIDISMEIDEGNAQVLKTAQIENKSILQTLVENQGSNPLTPQQSMNIKSKSLDQEIKITTTKTVDSSSDDGENDDDKSSSSSEDEEKLAPDDDFQREILKSAGLKDPIKPVKTLKDTLEKDDDSDSQSSSDSLDDEEMKKIKKLAKKEPTSAEIIQKIQKDQQKEKLYQANMQQLNKLSQRPQQEGNIMNKKFDLNDVMNVMNDGYGGLNDSDEDQEDEDDDDDEDFELTGNASGGNQNFSYQGYEKQLAEYKRQALKERFRKAKNKDDNSSDSDDDDDDDSDEDGGQRLKRQQQSDSSSSSSEDENEESKDPEKMMFKSAARKLGQKARSSTDLQQNFNVKNKSLIQQYKDKFQSSDYTKKIDMRGLQAQNGTISSQSGSYLKDTSKDFDGMEFDFDDEEEDDEFYKNQLEDDEDEDDDMNEEDEDALLMQEYQALDNNMYSMRGRSEQARLNNQLNVALNSRSRNMGSSLQNSQNQQNQQKQLPDINLNNLDEYLMIMQSCVGQAGMAMKRCINTKIKDRNFKLLADLGTILENLDIKFQQEQDQQAQEYNLRQQLKENLTVNKEESQNLEQISNQEEIKKYPIKSPFDQDEKEQSLTQERLSKIGQIYRYMLNIDEYSTHILEALLSNRFYLNTFRALDFHSDYQNVKAYDHIKDAKHISVVEFDNPLQQKRINALFRASYLKEFVFGKEDATKTQSLIKLMQDNSIEILKSVLNDHNMLKKIFDKAEQLDTQIEDLYNISRFIFELINRSKPIQSCLNSDSRKHIISESLIKKTNTFYFAKVVFKNDLRVQKQSKTLGLIFSPKESSKKSHQSQNINMNENEVLNSSQNLSVDNMSSISQVTLENFNEKINSQQTPAIDQTLGQDLITNELKGLDTADKINQEQQPLNQQVEQEDYTLEQATMYDNMIVNLLDYIYYLQTICHREVILYFLQDVELSWLLSQHLFITQNDGIRLQIIEVFKQLIDGAQTENQQQQIERLFKNTIFSAFQKIILSQNVNDFAWPVQYVYEFIQYICKPNIQQIQQMGAQLGSFDNRRERKMNTSVLRNFIFEEDLIQITLNLISNSSTNQYVRLMGVKFLKSLINSQDLNFFQKMNKTEVMQAMLKALEKTKEKIKPVYNMLESTLFEFINMFAVKVFEREDLKENFTIFIHEHQKELSWNQGLFKIFFDEQIQQRALNLGRTRASMNQMGNLGSQSLLSRYNQSVRNRVKVNNPSINEQKQSLIPKPGSQDTNQAQNAQQIQNQQNLNQASRTSLMALILREFSPNGDINSEECKQFHKKLLGLKEGQNSESSSSTQFSLNSSNNSADNEEEKDDSMADLEQMMMDRKRQRTEQSYFRFTSNQIGNGVRLPIQSNQQKQSQNNPVSQDSEIFTWDDDEDDQMIFKSSTDSLAQIKSEQTDNQDQLNQISKISVPHQSNQNISVDQFITDDQQMNEDYQMQDTEILSDQQDTGNKNTQSFLSSNLSINDFYYNNAKEQNNEDQLMQEPNFNIDQNTLDQQLLNNQAPQQTAISDLPQGSQNPSDLGNNNEHNEIINFFKKTEDVIEKHEFKRDTQIREDQ